jgi:hypothetical protein
LRQIEGKQAIASSQIATEMAAPPVGRTPMGTAAAAAIRVRMEVWRQWRGSQLTEDSPTRESEPNDVRGRLPGSASIGRRALGARMRRCLILRQGARPLRPPAPFPSPPIFQNGGNLSRVRKPRKNRAPLTASLRSEDLPKMRERGLSANETVLCLPLVGPERIPKRRRKKHNRRGTVPGIASVGRRALWARMRRCLILRQGARPLRPPRPERMLDMDRPSHGSRDRKGVGLAIC